MTRDLYRGMSGDDVLQLQQDLKSAGFYGGELDGEFGPVTETAVINFQNAYGIYADGIVGPITRSVIEGISTAADDSVIQGSVNGINASGSTLMARFGTWQFAATPDIFRSFKDMQISAGSEMEDSENSNQGFVSYKGARPTEVTINVSLNAFAGSDVRSDVNHFIDGSRIGWREYLYVGQEKIIDSLLLISDATVNNVVISPTGQWISADVALTFKQCESSDVYNGSSSGSYSGGSSYGGGGGGYAGGYANASTGSSKASVSKNLSPAKSSSSGAGLVAANGTSQSSASPGSYFQAAVAATKTIAAASSVRSTKVTTVTKPSTAKTSIKGTK